MKRKFLLFVLVGFYFVVNAQPDIRNKGNKGNKETTKPEKENTTTPKAEKALTLVSGKVTQEGTNEALIGASVSLVDKGSGGVVGGAYTNASGEFNLMADLSKSLQLKISYVGMKSVLLELTSGNTKDLAITMTEDVLGLEEVVITSFGQAEKKAKLGYSVQDISGDAVVKSGEVNLVNGLSAKVAGVQTISSAGVPGASSKILLRGASSINGDNQPLFVIDGVPMDNSTMDGGDADDPYNSLLSNTTYSNRAIDINPDDIESITVLKGPAAAALYGTRAGYGAIVITTKKGAHGKMKVEVGTTWGFDHYNRLIETQNIFSQGSGNRYNPRASTSYGARIDTLKINGQPAKSYDNIKNFFRTGTTMTNNISLSGGNDNSGFRVSFGQTEQTGIVPNTDFHRYTVRVTGESKLSDKLSINGTANYINSGGLSAQNGSNLSGVMLGLMRSPASFDLSGGYENTDGSQRTYYAVYDNPYWTVHKNTYRSNVNRMLGNVSAKYMFAPWIDLTYRVGTDFYSDNRKGIKAIGSNDFEQGKITQDVLNHREIYSDVLLSLRKSFTEKIFGSVTFANNINQRSTNRTYARGEGLTIPDFNNISNGSTFYASNSETMIRTAAFWMDANVEYNNMVFFNVKGRNEYSSTFGQNKGYFFPSVNLAFAFTELAPLKDNKILSYGKVRVAYSQAGHEPFPYATRSYYTTKTYGDGFVSGISSPFLGNNAFTNSDLLGNPNLKPERISSVEFGGEFKLLKNRISLDVTYYSQITTDMLVYVQLAPSSGYREQLQNAGKMQNKGWEIMLGARPVQLKNFIWDADINFTRNKNEVKELIKGVDKMEVETGFGDPGAFAAVGQPYGMLYGTAYRRDASGNIVVDADGLPIKDEQLKAIANPYPKFLLGFRNTFTIFKDFTVSALLDYRKGGSVWNGTLGRLIFQGTAKVTEDRADSFIFNGVTETGEPNNVKVSRMDYYRYSYNTVGGPSEAFIQDATWVRLRELSFAYNLKLDTKWIRGVEFSLTGRNLLLYTPNYKGNDPETSLTGAGSNIVGFEYFNMPNSRSFLVGAKFKF